MALMFARRPMTNSASSAGRPIITTAARYTTRNAAPPFSAVWNGNRQMLPNPTALPIDARMNPSLVAHVSLSDMFPTSDTTHGKN